MHSRQDQTSQSPRGRAESQTFPLQSPAHSDPDDSPDKTGELHGQVSRLAYHPASSCLTPEPEMTERRAFSAQGEAVGAQRSQQEENRIPDG